MSEELKRMSDDLDTMHGLKEEYRLKLEKAEARVKELEAYIKKTETINIYTS